MWRNIEIREGKREIWKLGSSLLKRGKEKKKNLFVLVHF